ncbi:hypothetical protein [Hymenobacter sediminicola]|uniref:Uncharacterized protein n=1 Tax=Hymenobacter sediminicola TaxID=2761579 RepID=A0A7G7WBZ3_9BACT|nr:hypothetical protein [Hymenobacter sediminicola]QNH63886.1 hypothetical protein H4317_08865 [Hymenobacter sediminicola]
MFDRIRKHLILFARHQVGTTSYLNLIQEADLGLNLDNSHEKSRLKELLADISMAEYAAGRPILSCLVEVKGHKGQGDTFYKLCEQLGMGEWRALRRQEDLLKNLRNECRAFWQDENQFLQHSQLDELPQQLSRTS